MPDAKTRFCEPDSDNEINFRNKEIDDFPTVLLQRACVLPPCAIGKTFNIIINWLII